MTQRLSEKYNKEVILAMQEKFGYENIMAIPRISKVVISSGFGKLMTGKTSDEQKKAAAAISDSLAEITGQKPILTKAKKSISSFKLREGMLVGAKVVLRGKKMYDFLERVISIAIPRLRDFRGIDPRNFDKDGNLTFGLKECTVFPEIAPEKTKINFGLEITVVTNCGDKNRGIEFLRLMGFPLKKD